MCVCVYICVWGGFTLSDKSLAGVQENLTALYDHALNGQVLSDVLSLAHLIVHDSRSKTLQNTAFIIIT